MRSEVPCAVIRIVELFADFRVGASKNIEGVTIPPTEEIGYHVCGRESSAWVGRMLHADTLSFCPVLHNPHPLLMYNL